MRDLQTEMTDAARREKPGCSGKKKHPSRQIANKFAMRMRGYGFAQKAYACPHCGRWHLSTMMPDRARPEVAPIPPINA